MSLKRFGVSLEDNLLESLDQYVNENGFANRSQAIRFLIEKNVAERKWLITNLPCLMPLIVVNLSDNSVKRWAVPITVTICKQKF